MTQPAITQTMIRRFIIDQFVDEPNLLPHPTDRFEHVGTIHASWSREKGKPPAPSRIAKAFRDLTKEGWLEEAVDPDFRQVPGFRINPHRLLQAMMERQP